MKLKALFVFILALAIFPNNLLAADNEKWNEYRSVHFIIYYKDAPQDFIRNVEDTAENYYREITRNLGFTRDKIWSWDDRAKI